jgi:hypothetical protein
VGGDPRLPRSDAHPFYTRLNQILDEHDFDGYVEGLCTQFYADDGRPGCRRLGQGEDGRHRDADARRLGADDRKRKKKVFRNERRAGVSRRAGPFECSHQTVNHSADLLGVRDQHGGFRLTDDIDA